MTRTPLAALLLTCLAHAACGDSGGAPATDSPTTQPATEPAAAKPPPAVDAPPYRRTRQMMGTVISITVVDAPQDAAASAVEAAFDEMERLEALLSEWREDSEISRINAAAGSAAVEVGPETLAVVKAGLEVSRWSEGAFDLSWAALHGLYKFGDEQRIATEQELAAALPLIDHAAIELDEEARTVKLTRAGMKIGTGGIAKGYALDRAGEVLVKGGVDNYMLFGGGQVQVRGEKEGRPWRVGIQHPRKDDYFAFMQVTRGSISTSGDYERTFVRDSVRYHHIIDPRTGKPVSHTTSVTVLADSGLYADAVSTAIFVMGPAAALERLASAPGNPRVIATDADLKLFVSPAATDNLTMKTTLDNGRLPTAD